MLIFAYLSVGFPIANPLCAIARNCAQLFSNRVAILHGSQLRANKIYFGNPTYQYTFTLSHLESIIGFALESRDILEQKETEKP